jgi:predicted nucleic-acid-binding protein
VIAVDTNVVVRLIVADDAVQGQRAARLFAQASEIFVAGTVLLETAWVLQSAYGFPRDQVAEALRRFAGLPNVLVEDAEQMAAALELAQSGMDVADALHLAACPEAAPFYTFDRRLVRHAQAAGLNVIEPEASDEPAPKAL